MSDLRKKAVEELKGAGCRNTDIAMILLESRGTKELVYGNFTQKS
jgi:hypothetical protein